VALWLNSVYSHIKGDLESTSRPLTPAERLDLRRLVEQAISRVPASGGSFTFSLSLKQLNLGPYALDGSLEYTLRRAP